MPGEFPADNLEPDSITFVLPEPCKGAYFSRESGPLYHGEGNRMSKKTDLVLARHLLETQSNLQVS